MTSCHVTVCVIFCFVFHMAQAYKPVVLVHGIFDHQHSLLSLAERIREIHPTTNVTIIDRFHGFRSLIPLWHQVATFRKDLEPIMADNPHGIHLIGFSQGGLIARGLIQSSSNHNVHNFISLSSPQAGQYGAWKVFYSRFGQDVSVGNYWRDPHHMRLFLNHSSYLPQIDNLVPSPNSSDFRHNFIRLKKLILIGGPDDGIISPWESSQFGVYNKAEEVVAMRHRLEYKLDLFGLRTLDKKNKIREHIIPGIYHMDWHRNVSVIDNYILPYLD